MSNTKQPVKPNWRQSSSWLHTWVGLFFGWILFMVFVTGTLSVFRDELTSWLRPEVLAVEHANQEAGLANAVNFLKQQGKASYWSINFPDRSPTIDLKWFGENEKVSKRGGKSAHLNPATGEQVQPRTTRFIDFLYRMHFELYNLPRSGARWFIGIATVAMFVALISGVIIHKRIFTDFFTFRPRKGQRSWLDLHNAASVLALPFHLMITFSGLLLLMYLLIPWGIQAAFDGDVQQYRKASGGRGGGSVIEQVQVTPTELSSIGGDIDLQLSTLTLLAQTHWPNGVSSIRVKNPNGQPHFQLYQLGADSIVSRGQSESLSFNSKSNRLTLHTIDYDKISTARSIYNVLTAWHLMRFADPIQRWLYFVAGIAGSFMIASGLLLWSKRREQKYEKQKLPSNLRWVSTLNITAIMGLFVAFIVTCIANRVIGYSTEKNLSTEIVIFFISWSVFFVYAWFRNWLFYNPKKAWRESLIFCAISYAALAIYDLLFILPELHNSAIATEILLSTTVILLLSALAALLTAQWLQRNSPMKQTKVTQA
ncbi:MULTISPECIES: PepSY-associated TM helix domain-containing protein [unclassified Pseudoalteromonas]|uniref:PepSY-associated TM helix domain-containing protein n=1 Tax=unclassified Pseudoalteromonas TaxID=194690 RepID=UPI0025B471CA|nr:MULTISPECIES: PepSY-associated TM helix domain-containing protein [unclassified Pseudoalteromonas]MDN3378657.1 PepSY-associated TM helix domain-containing protein [Pseudoalteromonas sp. APC 3893]MDN3387146.1 PepSY-associated TM helix domain-containing protein [Pseudoalteromonas sp. APC 4017]